MSMRQPDCLSPSYEQSLIFLYSPSSIKSLPPPSADDHSSLQIIHCDLSPCPFLSELMLSFCCLVNMCREQQGNQRVLSDAASWIKMFRMGKSVHRSCPGDGLQRKWISRLNSILTRRFKESTNVDLCYL